MITASVAISICRATFIDQFNHNHQYWWYYNS